MWPVKGPAFVLIGQGGGGEFFFCGKAVAKVVCYDQVGEVILYFVPSD